MDFIDIKEDVSRNGFIRLSPYLVFSEHKDIIVKGGEMAAFWSGDKWVKNGMEMVRQIDRFIDEHQRKIVDKYPNGGCPVITPLYLRESWNKTYTKLLADIKAIPSNDVQLDSKIIFKSTKTVREDYVIKRLSYDPKDGQTPGFDELYGTLYSEDELDKIMWSIGSVLTNNSRYHSKFLYLYGAKGTGKGTVLKLMKLLFEEYQEPIDLNILTSGQPFATGQIKDALVLIDDDSDMSKIVNDTILLKLTSHEPIGINKKHMAVYDYIFQGMLITASNQAFKVRNIDSGITRRGLVVRPTETIIPRTTYEKHWKSVRKEIPKIAMKCINRFNELGVNYYDNYIDVGIVEETNTFHRFVLDNLHEFKEVITLNYAAGLYKDWLEDEGYSTTGYKKQCKLELARYYDHYHELGVIDPSTGVKVKRAFSGFQRDKFEQSVPVNTDIYEHEEESWLEFKDCASFMEIFESDSFAQYAGPSGFPAKKWDDVATTLKEIVTSELHYTKLKPNHMVVDFDIKNDNGEKDLALNVSRAEKFPKTYAEVSKSGQGVHLHYLYEGDVTQLAPIYDHDIEVKVYSGNSSLRRLHTLNNGLEISTMPEGYLPYKKETNMYTDIDKLISDEKELRTMIEKNLRKEIHNATKPSIDFIAKLIKEAEDNNVKYDIRDMRQSVVNFAMRSQNQASNCLAIVAKMNFDTLNEELVDTPVTDSHIVPDEQLVFFDIEVMPNVNCVVYKHFGKPEKHVLINPGPAELSYLLKQPLVGFNNRGYDNHILWAMRMGYSPSEVYAVSKRIIENDPNAKYMQAYGLSYTDIYCYSTKKQSLKKWEVELGIDHDELEFDWDTPLPEEYWDRMVEYCGNDVDATEEVFKATYGDYTGRCILAELTGLTPNDKTTKLTAALIFGKDNKNPQKDFVYTDLSTIFPGYKYEYDFELKRCVSRYEYGEVEIEDSFTHPENSIDPSEGGYIYAEPGAYENVGLFDVESMHPSSLILMNYFGPYTQNYAELKQVRIHIKHGDLESARKMFNGRLEPYLRDVKMAKDLSYALKIAINIVYGMTSAKFDNPFKHPKNVDNIVAKRGALFMVDLQKAIQAKGYTVAHVKTDSVKVADTDEDIKAFVFEFGKKYGYVFEHEATYEKLVLISKTDYVAYDDEGWHITGATFQHPYVTKKCLTHEDINPSDLPIVKSVKDAKIYIGEEHVGKVANVYASIEGGEMTRRTNDGKIGAVSGTKDSLWKLVGTGVNMKDADLNFYETMARNAFAKALEVIGDKNTKSGEPFLYYGNK